MLRLGNGGFGGRSGTSVLGRFRILLDGESRRRRLGYNVRLLTSRSNRHLTPLRGRYSFGFCSSGGLKFAGGNRFDGNRGSRLWLWHRCGLRLRNNLTLSLQGGRSPLFYWCRPLDSSSIHVQGGFWLRFGQGHRSRFFDFCDSSNVRIKVHWDVR
jgi:hypothetical protein